MWNGEINPGTLVSLMLYTLNLAMSFALLSNLYGEFMQVSMKLINTKLQNYNLYASVRASTIEAYCSLSASSCICDCK